MLDFLKTAIDRLVGFSINRVDDSQLAMYERTLLALIQNTESALIEVIDRRNQHIMGFFRRHGFRLSRRRLKFKHQTVINRNITDVSFLVILPTQDDSHPIPCYFDQPVSLHVYENTTSKLLADWGVYANVIEAMSAVPSHYKDDRN